jgi:hypothetical protein
MRLNIIRNINALYDHQTAILRSQIGSIREPAKSDSSFAEDALRCEFLGTIGVGERCSNRRQKASPASPLLAKDNATPRY